MPSTPAFALLRPSGSFERTTIERREPGAKDVRIAIAFAGICHSDIHTAREEWGSVTFPLVPGHEIAGVVEAIGAEVTTFSIGDRVGVGCMVNSCRSCENCLAGEEQYCLEGNVGTYNATDRDGTTTQGGYSTHVVVDEHFVVPIPDGLGLDVAAPLLCAGITMFSPLNHWGAGPGTKVAIVGLGGLGHMGVKIAHAKGAEVTVLTRSEDKAHDAKRLGADHFVATGDPAALKALRGTFDLVLNTISAGIKVSDYLSLLRLDGALVNVGVSPEPYSVRFGNLAQARRTLSASGIGGIRETSEMLEFCAEHALGAEIEVIAASQIDEAYDRVVASDVRYRFVIDIATI
ncbi:MAG: NAD(P)-dependent alcohol dehydrogenase [Actinomycetes bacterium]